MQRRDSPSADGSSKSISVHEGVTERQPLSTGGNQLSVEFATTPKTQDLNKSVLPGAVSPKSDGLRLRAVSPQAELKHDERLISYNSDDTLKMASSTAQGLEQVRQIQDEKRRQKAKKESLNRISAANKAGEAQTVSPRLKLNPADERKLGLFRKNAGWILGLGVFVIVGIILILYLKTDLIVKRPSSGGGGGNLDIVVPTPAPTTAGSTNAPSPAPTQTPGTTPAPAATVTSAPIPAYQTPTCTLDQSTNMYWMKPLYGVKCFIRVDALGVSQLLDGTMYKTDLNPPTQGNNFNVEIYTDYDDNGNCEGYLTTINCS